MQVSDGNVSDRERRKDARFELNLTAQMNGEGYHDIEMVDISTSGLQIRTDAVDIFRRKGYTPNREERLNICLTVRLAWAEPHPDGGSSPAGRLKTRTRREM